MAQLEEETPGIVPVWASDQLNKVTAKPTFLSGCKYSFLPSIHDDDAGFNFRLIS